MDDDDDFEMFSAEAFLEAFAQAQQPYYRRARWHDVPVLALGLVHGVAEAVCNTLAQAHNIAAGHANFYVQQDEFHEQAAREIETMIAGEEQ